ARRLRTLLVLGAIAIAPANAHAGPKVNPKMAARALADKGYEAFQAGRYQEAADDFRQAEELFHAPTLVFGWARADAKLGKLIGARELFRRVVAEKLPPSAPEEFKGAKSSSESAVAELDAKIPKITLRVTAPSGLGFTVSLDDAPVAPSALGTPIEV